MVLKGAPYIDPTNIIGGYRICVPCDYSLCCCPEPRYRRLSGSWTWLRRTLRRSPGPSRRSSRSSRRGRTWISSTQSSSTWRGCSSEFRYPVLQTSCTLNFLSQTQSRRAENLSFRGKRKEILYFNN